MSTVTLTIDGISLQAESGSTILEAAKSAGISIPTMCHIEELSIAGACRMCIVEVEKARGLMAACATPVAEGMVVHTRSERVVAGRRALLEMYISDHPLDCMTCEKAGSCKLQDYAYEYGVTDTRFKGERRSYAPDISNQFFGRYHDKCIMCGQCIRMCHEVQGTGAIDFGKRGFLTKVSTAFDVPLEESNCVFCGNCIDVCPVGALIPHSQIRSGRTWQEQKTRVVCPYCGTGCLMYLHIVDGKISRVTPAKGPANNGHLCVKGRFGFDYIQHPDRLKSPLIKKDGKFVEASWDEAINLVASRLRKIKEESGPKALAGLSSAKCTNEENYLMQKLVRAVFGNNNIDHCARLCHASSVTGLAASFGSGAMTNSIEEIAGADVIFVIGSNTTEAHPVLALRIKEAVRKGSKLIVGDPRRTELAAMADVHLQMQPGTDVALLNGLMNVILREGLADEQFIAERTEGIDEVRETVKAYTPEVVEAITGVPVDRIERAAKLYANARAGSILYTMGITQHTTGTDNVLSIANLAMLTGNIGRPNTGVNPLRGQNNVQGACDMGALPDVFPGYQKVSDPEARAKFERAWGVQLDDKPGLTVTEIFDAILDGTIRGLYIMGENPMVSDPDINHVSKALDSVEFLVVQDIFLTETARKADVVLPGASYAEKDGTFTNTERRVQISEKALPPLGDSRPDWSILCDVATAMGYEMHYESSSEIADEMRSLTPIYAGISHKRLRDLGLAGLQWPCRTESDPGTKFLHKDKFSRGQGKFHKVDFIPPAEQPDETYPFIFTTGRILYHYHTRSMTKRSKALEDKCPEAFVEINPDTARELGIADGEYVILESRRGQVRVRARITTGIAPKVMFMPFHFAEAAANLLTNPAVDPKAKIPELKVCAVRVHAG